MLDSLSVKTWIDMLIGQKPGTLLSTTNNTLESGCLFPKPYGGFLEWGYPKMVGLEWKIPFSKMDDLGVPLFLGNRDIKNNRFWPIYSHEGFVWWGIHRYTMAIWNGWVMNVIGIWRYCISDTPNWNGFHMDFNLVFNWNLTD